MAEGTQTGTFELMCNFQSAQTRREGYHALEDNSLWWARYGMEDTMGGNEGAMREDLFNSSRL